MNGWMWRVMGLHVERWQADLIEHVAAGAPIRMALVTAGAESADALAATASPAGRYATAPVAYVCARCDVAGRGNACWSCGRTITWSGPTRAADGGVVPTGAGLIRQLAEAHPRA